MGHMVQYEDRMWLTPGEIVEIDGQTKISYEVEVVVFQPVQDVDVSVLAAFEVLDRLVHSRVD